MTQICSDSVFWSGYLSTFIFADFLSFNLFSSLRVIYIAPAMLTEAKSKIVFNYCCYDYKINDNHQNSKSQIYPKIANKLPWGPDAACSCHTNQAPMFCTATILTGYQMCDLVLVEERFFKLWIALLSWQTVSFLATVSEQSKSSIFCNLYSLRESYPGCVFSLVFRIFLQLNSVVYSTFFHE